MKISYSAGVETGDYLSQLADYRNKVKEIAFSQSFTESESSLGTFTDEDTKAKVNELKNKIGKIKYLVLVGIGGSSLGVEAVHSALSGKNPSQLLVLDSVSDHNLSNVLNALKDVKLKDFAVCLVSKSGGTTETLTNAEVLINELLNVHGESVYERVVAIGDNNNPLLEKVVKLGGHTVAMQSVVGGRYSVFTSVGLLPLSLLGYDTDAFLFGLKKVLEEDEEIVALSASSMYKQMLAGARVLNFFAFDSRLENLGKWYRQLAAESLGKKFDRDEQSVKHGFVPTISTAVELHSIGQLYFSGFEGVFTHFVSISNKPVKYKISSTPILADKLPEKRVEEIAYAIETGVIKAYEESSLYFKKTLLTELSEECLGRFMGAQMLEVMYLAELLNVDAFNQPNVELYKVKTKEVLNS